MQMQTNLDFVSLQVVDINKSAIFYTDVMGFKKGDSPNQHAVVFETEAGSIFAIRTPLIDISHVELKGAGISLWFKVANADKLYNKLIEKEVTILKPIQDGPFGRFFVLKDPDGYAITIHGES